MTLDYLETHLVDHCNLNCKGCGHFSPLAAERFVEASQFQKEFQRLSELFENISLIRLMGGEPLLHPNVQFFLACTRRAFPLAAISLVTNGILLGRQPAPFWHDCRENRIVVEITEYPISLDVEALKRTGQEFGVTVQTSWVANQFYRIVNIAGDSDPSVSFQKCQERFKCPFLRDGKLSVCGVPALVPIFNRFLEDPIPVMESDFIDIFDDVDAHDILEFLKRGPAMCRWCRAEPQAFPWQVSRRKVAEWTGPD